MKLKTEARRQAIIDVAAQIFRSEGFDRTSMSEICAQVGGSKATIYNYFSSKEELFTEVIMQSIEVEFKAVHQSFYSATKDISKSLRNFGEKFLSFLYSPEIQANRHMAIAQSRNSEIGRLIYQRGVLRSQKLIAQFLNDSMSKDKLRQADPDIAARHLISLLESELIDRFLYQLAGEISESDIKKGTLRAIDVFMAAYSPEHQRKSSAR